jgi:hypothetical protein
MPKRKLTHLQLWHRKAQVTIFNRGLSGHKKRRELCPGWACRRKMRDELSFIIQPTDQISVPLIDDAHHCTSTFMPVGAARGASMVNVTVLE